MSVSFITGRIGCNKTDKILDLCFEEAKNKSRSPIFILVPEKYTYEIEKRLSERLRTSYDPYFRIRVVSFSTLSNIVYTNAGGLKERKISKSARSMLIYKAIDSVSKDLVTFKASSSGVGLINRVLDMIIEFKQNSMTVDDVYKMSEESKDEALRSKLKDIAMVYEKYEDLLENNYFDTEDNLEFFAKKLDEFEGIKGATIFVDEFTGFTPIQYNVIEKLIIYSKNIYFSLTTDLKNFNSRTGVFSKTNITFMKINDICRKHGIKRERDVQMIGCEYYDNLVLKHLEESINEYNPKMFEKNDCDIKRNLRILEFQNTYKEVEYIAGEIVRLVRDEGYRYREITIAMREMESYAYIIRGIFEDYNIGYFIDDKIAAKNNPIIVLILSILEMKQKNYSYDSMFRYLKSGLIPIDNTDISKLENYVLANGIKGKRWFDEEWDYPISHAIDSSFVEDDEELEYYNKINDIKDRVMKPIRSLHEKLKNRNKVEEICRYLYEFAIDIELPSTIKELIEKFEGEENLYKAKEYSQVWKIFTEMLDEMVEFIGNETIGLERFIKLMEAEFDGFELGIIPPSRDQVFVTTVDRMKNPDMKILFLIGVGDGVFPQNLTDNAMINDNDRNKLLEIGVKFDTDVMVRAYDEQYLIYKAMSSAKSRLIISYSTSDFEGKALRPSSVIKKIRKMFPDLKVEVNNNEIDEEISSLIENVSSKEKLFDNLQNKLKSMEMGLLDDDEKETWGIIYHYFCKDDEYRDRLEIVKEAMKYANLISNIDETLAEKIYGKGVFSISKLEKFVSCPFAYFVNYGLRAKERDIYEFNAMDSGSYAHKILDEFSKRIVINGIEWSDIDRAYIEDEVNRISRKIIEEKKRYILKSSTKYKYLTNRINNNLIDSIGIMAEQVRRGDFKPKSFEVEFGFKGDLPPIKYKLENGKSIVLTGKIDRVDIYDSGEIDYVRVIDYKSSKKDLDIEKIMAGIQMQLFVYINAVLKSKKKLEKSDENKKANYKPAAILYSRFNIGKTKVDGMKELKSIDSKELENRVLSDNMLNGFVVKEKEVIDHLDKTLNEDVRKSNIMKITKLKNGDIGKYTVGLSEEDFNVVSDYVIEKTSEICEKIYSGNISIEPYKFKHETPCTYCDFKSICQFDTTIKSNRYKIIKKNSYDEVLNLMKLKLREKAKKIKDEIEEAGDE